MSSRSFFAKGAAVLAVADTSNVARDLEQHWYGYEQLAPGLDELSSFSPDREGP